MATIFMDGSETGSNGWADGGISLQTDTTAGVWSTYSMSASGNNSFTMYMDGSADVLYGQFHVYLEGNSHVQEFRFLSPLDTEQCHISWDSGERITIETPSETVLATGTTVLQYDRWYYVQFYIKIHDTLGECTIKVDGVTQFTATGLDTRSDTTTANVSRIAIACTATQSGNRWDDIIINDTTGTDNTSYPDWQGIEALMPNAAGDNTGLTRGGTDSGSNYGQVDERPPNTTDYVYSSTVDLYDIYNLPATQWPSVSAVALFLRAQKSDAGAANIAHMLKIDTDASGTADELDTGSDVPLSTSWSYHSKIYNRQPDNAGDTSWTANKVNALQAGAKVR